MCYSVEMRYTVMRLLKSGTLVCTVDKFSQVYIFGIQFIVPFIIIFTATLR